MHNYFSIFSLYIRGVSLYCIYLDVINIFLTTNVYTFYLRMFTIFFFNNDKLYIVFMYCVGTRFWYPSPKCGGMSAQ